MNLNSIANFVHINIYGIILFILAISFSLIPFYKISYWYILPQLIIVFSCMKFAFSILKSWKDKKRMYNILFRQNVKEFKEESFYKYMMTPCGRALARTVLRDIGCSNKYPLIKKNAKNNLKLNVQFCKTSSRKKPIVRTIEDYLAS